MDAIHTDKGAGDPSIWYVRPKYRTNTDLVFLSACLPVSYTHLDVYKRQLIQRLHIKLRDIIYYLDLITFYRNICVLNNSVLKQRKHFLYNYFNSWYMCNSKVVMYCYWESIPYYLPVFVLTLDVVADILPATNQM